MTRETTTRSSSSRPPHRVLSPTKDCETNGNSEVTLQLPPGRSLSTRFTRRWKKRLRVSASRSQSSITGSQRIRSAWSMSLRRRSRWAGLHMGKESPKSRKLAIRVARPSGRSDRSLWESPPDPRRGRRYRRRRWAEPTSAACGGGDDRQHSRTCRHQCARKGIQPRSVRSGGSSFQHQTDDVRCVPRVHVGHAGRQSSAKGIPGKRGCHAILEDRERRHQEELFSERGGRCGRPSG